jgi:WD40 repeat protein
MKILARSVSIRVSAALGFGALAMGAILLAGPAAQAQEHVRLVPQLGMDSPTFVIFSPDGRSALTGSSYTTARLWDLATGRQIRSFNERGPQGVTATGRSAAFSADGRFVLTAGENPCLWEVATGKQIRVFKGHTGYVRSVAFSTDGRFVLSGGKDKTARLWDAATGQQIRIFKGHTAEVTSVAFSPNGRLVITQDWGNSVRFWDTNTGEQVTGLEGNSESILSVGLFQNEWYVVTRPYNGKARMWNMENNEQKTILEGDPDSVNEVVFARDRGSVVTRSEDGRARIWDLTTEKQIGKFNWPNEVTRVAFSQDGQFALTGDYNGVFQLWDTTDGKEIRSFLGHTREVNSTVFSPDGRSILIGSDDKAVRLWDTGTGQQIRQFAGVRGVFSPDGLSVLTAGIAEWTAQLWDAASGKQIRSLVGQVEEGSDVYGVESVGFSGDGRFAVTQQNLSVRVWDTATGNLLHSFPGMHSYVSSVDICPDGRNVAVSGETVDGKESAAGLRNTATGDIVREFPERKDDRVTTVSCSPDSRNVLIGYTGNTLRLYNAATGVEVRPFTAPLDGAASIAFSPDGRFVLAGGNNSTAQLWDTASGQQIKSLAGHSSPVSSVALSPDDRFMLTGSDDTTARLWDTATGKQLATLLGFETGGWAVVDPEGRFDTSDLDGGAPLVWVADSEPMRPLPLEIFMRDYYTPRLLARIMNGETLPPIRSIVEITNRVQPDVAVVSVSASKTHPGRADVVVHAARHTNEKGQASGLQDLRLFRNGQMVGYLKGSLKDGDYTFKDIQLPTSVKSVTFTAYAFNSMNIKSATAEKDYAYEPGAAVRPHAYLLQIGVNHYQASGCELHGSVTDAEELSGVLTDRLTKRGLDVKPVRLISTGTENGATKEKIRDALQAIAAVATPDDAFFLSFSGHGYGDKDGQFYIFPSDVQGSCNGVDDAMLKNAISADELTEWLRPIDAGEMTFILDSCQSASSVEANDFKPGPMGSRGLGQLAYDKRMRILAASQSNQEAQERNLPAGNGEGEERTQGLLSYVLTEEGLVEGKADWRPEFGTITVGKWLSYAADAVPKSLEAGAVKTPRGMKRIGPPTPHAKSAQIPAVFDFSKKDTLQLQ